MTDKELLGAYSSIFAPALLIQAATGYIYNPFATVFARDFQKNNFSRVKSTVIKIILAMTGLSVLILVAVHFLGDFLFSLVFGEQILQFSYLIIPVIIATILLSFLGFLCMLEIIIRDFVGLIIGCSVGAATVFAMSVLLINHFSAQGASYAIIIATAAAIGIVSVSIVRKINKMKSSSSNSVSHEA